MRLKHRSLPIPQLTALASALSHEISHPLGIILNSAFYLKLRMGKQSDNKINQRLSDIEEQAKTAAQMISKIVKFTRLSNLTFSRQSLKSNIEQAILMTSIPSRIDLKEDIPVELPEMMLNSEKIIQTIGNILQNAIEAIETQGSIKIRLKQKGRTAEILISDSGSGISKENINKIFDPFFSTKARGLGLGLSIANRVVTLHGGKIRVKSKRKNGTTFTINLPILISTRNKNHEKK